MEHYTVREGVRVSFGYLGQIEEYLDQRQDQLQVLVTPDCLEIESLRVHEDLVCHVVPAIQKLLLVDEFRLDELHKR